MTQDIDRKLRLTAAVLGVSRKDLAAAFRRINPNTSFDVARADKWLQGRAKPREAQLYEDWAKVLELDHPGRWIADCDFETFIEETAKRHGRDSGELRALVDPSAGRTARDWLGLSLAGTYVCYSHAWWSYFHGRLIRGELSIGPGRPDQAPAHYTENAPPGRLHLEGTIVIDNRGVHLAASDPKVRSGRLHFFLFAPSPPVSVLGGLMTGMSLIGPDAQPSTTRIVMIRLPAVSERLRTEDCYLPADASVARDLAGLGLRVGDPRTVDGMLATFLNGGGRGGLDQVPVADYRALVELCDRIWLDTTHGGALATPGRGGTVQPFPGRRTAEGSG